MREIRGEARYLWVFCDIDGKGEKFRLAIENNGFLFFPVEDFYENDIVFEDAVKYEIEPPTEAEL